MRRLLILSLFVPVLSLAEIPLVTPKVVAQLERSDGRTFTNRTYIRQDGDRVAVMDAADTSFAPSDGSIHIFARQPNGSWAQTASMGTPAGFGTLADLSFGDDYLLVMRRNGAPDGIVNNITVLERVNGNWVQTASPPVVTNGQVIVKNNWMAVSRLTGVEMFRHLANGQWQSSALLAEDGVSGIGSGKLGVGFDFDGHSVAVGTNEYEGGYFTRIARIFQQDANGNWIPTARLSSQQSYYSISRVAPVRPSLSGRDATVGGVLFHDNGYGYWEEIANPAPDSENLDTGASAVVTNTGWALVATPHHQLDVYAKGANGFWRPRARLAETSPAIVAVKGDYGIAFEVGPVADPRIPVPARLSVVSLPGSVAQAFEPARITDTSIFDAMVTVGGVTYVSAFVDVNGTPGATVRSVEVRSGSDAWQLLVSRDGAFDESFESVTGTLSVPAAFTGSLPVCFRVTDSAGRQTEMLDRGREPCPIAVALARKPAGVVLNVDPGPPQVSGVMLYRTAVSPGEDNAVYAFADDSDTGDVCTGQPNCYPTSVAAMQFRIDTGVWRAMKPFAGDRSDDFTFGDSEYEAAQGALPPASGYGMHQVCVRGMDTWGNVSQPQCVSYLVR